MIPTSSSADPENSVDSALPKTGAKSFASGQGGAASLLSPDQERILELEKELTAALEKNAELEKKITESAEKELRLLADVQNVRRRMEEERSQLIFEAGKKILQEFLPVLDNFDRAVENLPAEISASEWGKGVLAIQKQSHDFLEKEGITEISALDVELDPHQHEAVMMDPEKPQGKVSRILRKGYSYLGRVLRPAQVAVGSKE